MGWGFGWGGGGLGGVLIMVGFCKVRNDVVIVLDGGCMNWVW